MKPSQAQKGWLVESAIEQIKKVCYLIPPMDKFRESLVAELASVED